MKTLEECADEMCKAADDLEKIPLTPGTPWYDFQQSIVAAARRYRKEVIEEAIKEINSGEK